VAADAEGKLGRIGGEPLPELGDAGELTAVGPLDSTGR
jgi:hypothetical protein